MTLLVISGGAIPNSYAALLEALKDVPAFLASFAAIVLIWGAHRRWSRRYGLEDGWTTLISLGMVFVMLVYVYPLRMVASAFMAFVSGGRLPMSFTFASRSDLTGLFVVYGVGFALQTAMVALLYFRALRAGDRLRLDRVDPLRHERHWVLVRAGQPVVERRHAARSGTRRERFSSDRISGSTTRSHSGVAIHWPQPKRRRRAAASTA